MKALSYDSYVSTCQTRKKMYLHVFAPNDAETIEQ